MNKKLLPLLLLFLASACTGGLNGVTGPVDMNDLLADVKGKYKATFRTAAGEKKTVFITLRDRRENRARADEAADFPLGVRLETDDEFILSFAVAEFPSTGPNKGNLVLFQRRSWNYVSINSRFDRRLLSPEDRFISSGLWLNPLDDRWIYPLDGHKYLLDEIRFGEAKGRFVLRRLFFGDIMRKFPRSSLFIHHFQKVKQDAQGCSKGRTSPVWPGVTQLVNLGIAPKPWRQRVETERPGFVQPRDEGVCLL